MKLAYSVQLSSISLSPSSSLSSPRDDPPTPPSRRMAFTTVFKSAEDVLGCLRCDDCQCGSLASRLSLSSLQMGGGGIPVNLASHQDNDTVCNELQSNNLAHKGGGREGGLILFGFGAGEKVVVGTRCNVANTKHWCEFVQYGKFLTGIVFYVTNIPRSTCTICEHNLIKWHQ
jgi:hypothetical protein